MAEWNDVLLNPFFIVSQFAFWANLLLFAILSRRSKSLEERLCATLILSFAIWSLGDSMMRISPNLRMAALWNDVSGLGWCLSPPLFFHAAAVMNGRKWKLSWLYLPSSAFVLLLWFSPHINSGVELTRWGYSAMLGDWIWTYLVVSTLLFAAGIILLSRSERPLLSWLGLTTLVMLIMGSATDIVLPLLGVHIELFPLFTIPISLVVFVVCGFSRATA